MAFKTDKVTIEPPGTSDPFIYYKGTPGSTTGYNITSLNGSGSITGPKDTGGWTWAGMMKVTFKNGSGDETTAWTPFYVVSS